MEALMRIGIDTPTVDEGGHIIDAAALAVNASNVERAGFDGIWNGDTSYYRGSHRGGVRWTQPDPLMLSLIAAAATERVEVGLAVYQVPLREPVDLAQRLMTLAAYTGNRFTCGVGAGSTAGAFAAVGVPFENRFAIFHQHMAVVRQLLAGETVGEAHLPPWPETRGGPRLVLGAWQSQVSLRRAAREYDGWMSSSALTNISVMSDGIKRYRDLGGRRAMTTTCRIDLRAPNVRLDESGPFDLICGHSEAVQRVGLLLEMGFDDLCVKIVDHTKAPGTPRSYSTDDLEEIRSLVPRDLRVPWSSDSAESA
jgi:alkanesulfonate monooxygenase SsuD/methylene tetrahydromethanopterin reductase-like flavin-dependent oxidoreductase (luciferase family)